MEYTLDRSLALDVWKTLDEFTQGYVEAAMWTLTDDDGNSLDYLGLHDIAPETLEKAKHDCKDFQESNRAALDSTGANDARHGHDFWLTRNHRGAGFWDRGYGAVGDELTNNAHAYSGADWYVGDDGNVYQYQG